ncbi:2,4-dienoyl-CoA reductase (NADPH2) [Rhizobium sp. BK275]|uniref:NADH-dependent flavin oxidoreductase n=1 Tax=Rhizobium sp. BK275 TaxID=2587077 RepID=UPI00161EB8D7|nr:NADH-dependent flavin oxidoreductase [Rhizobium sp. BK275]MBB3389719.1 2,4-dienoyl-CoA reductase (NADPH2) [Rhizobium sp. BK275]
MMDLNKLFMPFEFAKGITLRNRVAMAPMTTWSGNADGTVSDEEIAYYRRRVTGVGLVITGCTHVQPNGIGFTDEFASYDDKFIPSLKRLADAAKSGGAAAVLQIFHAGNKAIPSQVPHGDVISASPVATEASSFAPSIVPREMSEAEILAVVKAFGDATLRAIRAGFDGVELHGAHGFLLQNFLSPFFNRRMDRWGGSLENRMRFPLAVVAEVKRVVDTHAERPFVVGYRISPEESLDGGLRITDALELVDCLVEAGINYIHASVYNVLNARPLDGSDGPLTTSMFIDRVAERVPLIAAGQLRTPKQAVEALSMGLSLVAVGKGLVMNPGWVEDGSEGRDDKIDTTLDLQNLSHLLLPPKLVRIIEAMPGWFPVEGMRETT